MDYSNDNTSLIKLLTVTIAFFALFWLFLILFFNAMDSLSHVDQTYYQINFSFKMAPDSEGLISKKETTDSFAFHLWGYLGLILSGLIAIILAKMGNWIVDTVWLKIRRGSK